MFSNSSTSAARNLAPFVDRESKRPVHHDAAAPVESEPLPSLTFRRGPVQMVVFRDCPPSSVVMSLRQAQVMVGLALTSEQFAKVQRLDRYGYVHISARSNSDRTLAMATADLVGAGWAVEEDTACIDGATGNSVTHAAFAPAS